MKLVFATNNPNKLSELQDLVPEGIEILSLKDINCNEELPETNPTLEGNALQKAQYVYQNYGFNCFADDTGLEIEALGGFEKLIETLKKRFEEQKERHQGGNKWIGTAGTSPFGAHGYNPEGVRIGQAGSHETDGSVAV